MTIDVDTIVTDADLDEFLGGQLNASTTLRPHAWTDAKPARQYALDEVVRLLKRSHPSLAETDIDTSSASLKRAVLLGSAARLYALAMTHSPEPGLFFALEKRYLGERNDEIRALGDELATTLSKLDTYGRGRRSVSLVRR